MWVWFFIVASAAAVDCSIFLSLRSPLNDQNKEVRLENTIDHFKTAIGGANTIPDPLKIYSANEWYILDAVSETLLRFDSHLGTYVPSIAATWTFDSRGIVIKVKPDLKFSDGTALTLKDILASFRRIVRAKTSTHYQIWNHLPDCNADSCNSIRIENGDTLIIDYRGDRESLFMFLSSPEGSIWSEQDVQAKQFKPTRFSGFYYPESVSVSGLVLTKNIHNVRTAAFPRAPGTITAMNLPLKDSLAAFERRELDAVLVAHTPFKSFPFTLADYQVHRTVPLSFNYLLRMKRRATSPFSKDFLGEIWKAVGGGEGVIPSYGILPPGVEGVLTKEEAVSALVAAPGSPAQIDIGVFMPFHSQEFADLLVRAGAASHLKINIVKIGRDTFFSAIEKPEEAKFDYLLSAYVASDKFPLTQLKLILGHHSVPFDFYKTNMDSPETLKYLKSIQAHILREQLIIPLFYAPELILAHKSVNLGHQPTTDAELQLWRINEISRPR